MKQLNWYQIFGQTHTIPDGRTVLPTDDIQIWLNCADIWDKTYTTLAEVLADTDTLSALIASNNAVDYMVRSTTWAVEISVPELTGATDKATGVADAWKAFQTNESNGAQVAPGDRVIYEFDNPICVIDYHQPKVSLGLASATYTYKIQGSNDKVAWVDLATDTVSNWVDGIRKPLTTSGLYRYVALYCDSQSGGSGHYLLKLNFYSASITDNATAMSYIGLNNYCANTLLADSTWCSAICNSEYFESVLNVKVPAMTGYNTPIGLVFVRNNYATDYGWCAFDGNSETRWISASGSIADNYIGYEFTEKINICLIEMKGGNTSSVVNRTIHDYKLQSSDDRNTWQDIGNSRTFSQVTSVQKAVIVEQTNNYDFRILVQTNYGGSYVHVTSLQFYGRKDV